MAINAWLLGGVITDDHITPEIKSCWERKDLVDVPAMISYASATLPDSGIRIYSNNVGCKIILVPYGEFQSHEDIEKDYYNEGELYTNAYQMSVSTVSKRFGRRIKDLDWVMPVMEGDLVIEQNFCYIPDLREENKELVSLIDCSMIYSTVKMISSFVNRMCGKNNLTKFEQYQLAYYQTILQGIEKPDCFLVNKREIDIVSCIYEVWGITSTIENASGNAKQAVMLFSFLSNYQSAYENELFSSFLTFFGIVVGFEAIYNIVTVMIGGQSSIFDVIFSIAIMVILSVYAVIFCRKVWRRQRERIEFQHKTATRTDIVEESQKRT